LFFDSLAASVAVVRATTSARAAKRQFNKSSSKNNYVDESTSKRMPSLTKTVKIPAPTIVEVTEDSSHDKSNDFDDKKPSEYTRLLHPRDTKKSNTRRQPKKYESCVVESSDNSDGDQDAGDELSSNSSSSFTNSMSNRQLLVFVMVMISTCSSSLSVCLFPPFFPALAESKGVYATGYGLIIGTNCLVAFLVTPLIGNNLGRIGVKFSYCAGLFGGGVCCALSGMLEFIHPGPAFLAIAVAIRVFHAISNAFVITASFTYTACEFPTAMAKIFALTRTAMNIAQMCGPWLGGMMLEIDGFYTPFVILGSSQVAISFVTFCLLPHPDTIEDEDDEFSKTRKKKGKASVCKILSIPTVWFSFIAFVVATMCNGFLSVNLEPKVLRFFDLSPSNVGLLYGLKDGSNSLASPVWGFLCDRKKSVKPYLVASCFLVALSFFLMKAFEVLHIPFELNIYLLVLALCVNGIGISGQQIVGVVDALHEAGGAGFPDDPSTQGLIAGLWSSLSGGGRFISRAGSGYLVDHFGFSAVSALFCCMQIAVGLVTFIYLVLFECSIQKRDYRRLEDVTFLEQGRGRDEKVVFTAPSGEALMARSVYIGIPNLSTGARIANSMPPKMLKGESIRNRSRSVR